MDHYQSMIVFVDFQKNILIESSASLQADLIESGGVII
jgi:hypothetical protein